MYYVSNEYFYGGCKLNLNTEYIIEVWDKEHEEFDHLKFKLNDKGKMFLFTGTYPEGIQFYEFRKIKTRQQMIECCLLYTSPSPRD